MDREDLSGNVTFKLIGENRFFLTEFIKDYNFLIRGVINNDIKYLQWIVHNNALYLIFQKFKI